MNTALLSRLPVIAAAAAALLLCGDALAWRSLSHHRMVRDSVGFLPPALQGLLRLYAADLHRGVQESAAYTAELFSGRQGPENIAAALEREVYEVTGLINAHRPFAQVFYRYGRLVGPLAELSAPLGHGGAEPLLLPARESFDRLSEAAAQSFRIGWNGYRHELLRGVAPRDYFLQTSRDAASLYPVLYSALVVDGRLVPAETFDFRSIPFGVASISYSRAVNTVVNVWCAIWREAGGDMTGLPY
jgi:hypothetical protein